MSSRSRAGRSVRPRVEALEERALLSAGALDPGFANGGKVVTNLSNKGDFGKAVAVQRDGKVVVAGQVIRGTSDFAVTRFNTNGTLDRTFGPDHDGKVFIDFAKGADSARGVVVQPDGKIVVAGATTVNGGDAFALARLNASGAPDRTFGPDHDGLVTAVLGGEANAVALQKDGKIVAAGTLGNADFAAVRFDRFGNLDPLFGIQGLAVADFGGFDEANAVLILGNGRIVLGGATTAGGVPQFGLAGFTPQGLPDPVFGTAGQVKTNLGDTAEVNALAFAGGKIVAVGDANQAGKVGFALARYDGRGNPDAGFGGGGKVVSFLGTNNFARAFGAAALPDGRVVAAGLAIHGGGLDWTLAAYRGDGKLDGHFGNGGVAFTDLGSTEEGAEAVALGADGKLVAVGATNDSDTALARYENDQFQFGRAVFRATEAGRVATITVRRVGGVGGFAAVQLPAVSGTATAGKDFKQINVPLLFKPGQAFKIIKIPLVADAFTEPAETVRLFLDHVSGRAGLGAPTQAVLEILDSPVSPPKDVTPMLKVSLGAGFFVRPGVFVRVVSVTNPGPDAIHGPLTVVPRLLTPGVELLPAGSPGRRLKLATGVLLPGQSVKAALIFSDPLGLKVSFVPHVLAGVL